MTSKGFFQKPAANARLDASSGIYRITIYLQHGGGDHHGRVPRFGGAALPHSQIRGRRGRGGASRGPRTAAVCAVAGAARASRGRGSDDSHAGGPAGAEASQRGGTDRPAGGPWLRAPEPQPGRPPPRSGGFAAARRKTARTGGARPYRRVTRKRRSARERHQRSAGSWRLTGGQEGSKIETRKWKIDRHQ